VDICRTGPKLGQIGWNLHKLPRFKLPFAFKLTPDGQDGISGVLSEPLSRVSILRSAPNLTESEIALKLSPYTRRAPSEQEVTEWNHIAGPRVRQNLRIEEV
jgi:hypothetical protein